MRPTSYDKEVLEKANEYLEYFEDLGDKVPTVAGLCGHIKRSRSTVYKWAEEEDKVEFSDILDQVMQYQEQKLVNGGLSNQFNSTITKMMMTKHGYSDKQEIDHQSSDGSMTPKGMGDFYAAVEDEDEEE